MDDDTLRHIAKKDLHTLVFFIESMLTSILESGQSLETEVYKYSEMIELELAFKCLQMPILEKKFIGHSILANKINQTKTKDTESS